ncbi:hypothetical protein SAMN05421765_1304 [Kaistella antarctica]|uniref:Uncharacterized protein n=1 Tax=Kaistella antarctica TaxID=266748 RepID=A0A448NMG5_9FLAO|nr:hypothetical protein SAMN05421765_1304 [Kaistella antarctica]VEH95424.1 Uncharacterised protein [Kaistella antarctica]
MQLWILIEIQSILTNYKLGINPISLTVFFGSIIVQLFRKTIIYKFIMAISYKIEIYNKNQSKDPHKIKTRPKIESLFKEQN